MVMSRFQSAVQGGLARPGCRSVTNTVYPHHEVALLNVNENGPYRGIFNKPCQAQTGEGCQPKHDRRFDGALPLPG